MNLKGCDEEMITLRDTLTNLSFDYTSIVVEPWLEGDILDRAGSSVIFTLHNHTYYRRVGIVPDLWHEYQEIRAGKYGSRPRGDI